VSAHEDELYNPKEKEEKGKKIRTLKFNEKKIDYTVVCETMWSPKSKKNLSMLYRDSVIKWSLDMKWSLDTLHKRGGSLGRVGRPSRVEVFEEWGV
jgi:hypothetical protein